MEETDPAQILPAKRHIVETSAPGSVGPMAPPMGMPMSPHTPAVPGEPVSREAVTADLPPAQEFGSPAVFLANQEPRSFTAMEPAVYGEPVASHAALTPQFSAVEPAVHGEPVLAHAALEPRTLPVALEPRTLPVAVEPGERVEADRDCCSCCGNSHDGQENRPVEREEPVEHPRGHHRDDEERGEERGEHEHEGGGHGRHEHERGDHHHQHRDEDHKPDREERDERGDSCACCGEDHPGLDTTDPKDPPPGGVTDTEGETEPPTEHADSEDWLPPTESDTCGPDSKPDQHDGPQQTPESPTKPGTPLSPTEPQKPGTPLTPTESIAQKPGIPLTPTESSTGYAVAEKDKPAGPGAPGSPRESMAPPLSNKLAPMRPDSGTPPLAVPRGSTGGQSTPATPVEPKTFTKSAGPPGSAFMPSTPGSPGMPPVAPPVVPQEPSYQGQRVQAPLAPVVTTPQQTGGETQQPPPTEATPDQYQPPSSTPGTPPAPVTNAGSQPGSYSPGYTGQGSNTPGSDGSGTGNPFTLPGGGGYGGSGVPTDGNVGPDPNVKFDETQYNQLITVIAEVQGTLDDATSIDVVYLDAELKLQPNGQTWEYATNLVTRGGRFGGSVDTESTNLEKTLSSFHTALEQAKEVFKETDDLAAYDATRFSTDYPGFGSGGPGLV